MDIATIIISAVVLLLLFYLVSIYNHLVRIKHNVSKAWSRCVSNTMYPRPGRTLMCY